jgi:two-component system cell cycle sensor histidine kinase/response regulator CckA
MQDTVRTILVIEDEDGVRNLLRALLRLSGYEVLSCQDGSEALDLMEARGGSVHLLVTDVNLGPGMDGFEAAARLRARQPDLKVLYMSGRDESDAGSGRVPGPCDGFLPKPFTPRGFTEAVASMLRPVSADAALRPA